MNTTENRPKVLIIGSGFGGLFAARALKRADVDIQLIARTTHHLFQPLLYQVATGILSPGEIAPATREVLARQDNVQVELGEVTAVDLDARTVTASTLGVPRTLHYDHLIVAAGANQSWFGHDEFADYAPGMKSIDDALELRGRIFGAFELAELAAAEGRTADARAHTTFVVVGAGPTGVEMAGQLAELSHRTLRHDFRHIDPRDAKIYLMDAADAVLGSFDESLQRKTRTAMEKLGVDVLLEAKVVDVDARGLDYEDADGQRHRIDALTKVWAAGVAASPLASQLADQVGLEVDRSGRIPVRPDLTLPGHPDVYVIGDMMTLDGLPGVAQVAIQQARYAAKKIGSSLGGRASLDRRAVDEPFAYFDKGNMATISRFRAIAEIGRLKVTGFVAWLLWLGVHLVYIIGFKSRITTLLHWVVSFLGRGRSERTVTQQQVFGRLAMDQVDGLAERAGRNLGWRQQGKEGRPDLD
ncbi:NAD(P)/FAD-dependent oxidoreductase [Ornithinimicrobium cryptoxanthini]|uniref:NADH:ubiquinone reductase (non-electrogenic) n=1 Tax=Ornithinimicrobium cryptoxanthini TaxID=2934161 RepID=A0ABY4YKK1_9MICO|nr:NAD(P)/FAD-dependent oxidoreductase [Ornithinimicrobium cryptoxanthini]USQ77147.1 NAD(P)/FAD-dependent oxidoreductase [Ornithinimicrobium cryptoxanthini]